MKFLPALGALVGALLPVTAFGNASITVQCTADCRVKIDGKRGEKVSDREYKYDQIPVGIWEVEVSRGFKEGYADIPAEGEVLIEIGPEAMLVNGQPALDRKGKRQLEKTRRDAAEAEKRVQEQAERERRQQERKEERERRQQEKAAAAAPKPEGAKTKMVVVGLLARTGLDQATADLFGDALVGELRKRPGLQVTDRSDVAAVLGADSEKQLLGCTDNTCVAEVAGAMGAELLVRGTIGRVGKTLMVNLSLIDATKATAAATVSEPIKSNSDEAFFEQLPRLVDLLLKKRGR